MNRGGAKEAVPSKGYVERTNGKLTGINDTVECVSLQETFELHVKA